MTDTGLKKRLLDAKKFKNNRAFTLTEVIVASALLIVAVVPILRVLTAAHVIANKIEYKTLSLNYARAELERIKAASIYNFAGGFGQTDVALGRAFLQSVTDSPASADLRLITVSVGHDDDTDNRLDSDEIQVNISSYIVRRI